MTIIRKTMALSADLWAAVEAYRVRLGLATTAEAVRRLIIAGIAAERRKP